MANNNWGWLLLVLGAAAGSGLLVYSIMRSKEQQLLADNSQLMQVITRRNRQIESVEQRLSDLENVQLQYNDLQLEYNNLIAGIDHIESQETDPNTKQKVRELKARAKRQKQLAVS